MTRVDTMHNGDVSSGKQAAYFMLQQSLTLDVTTRKRREQ